MAEITRDEIANIIQEQIGPYDVTSIADAIFARLRDGWSMVNDEAKIGTVLLIAMYPNGLGWTDIYQCWWSDDEWVRWPHNFPPTHYMRATHPKGAA